MRSRNATSAGLVLAGVVIAITSAPDFAISGTEVETGLRVEIDSAILDLAVWP